MLGEVLVAVVEVEVALLHLPLAVEEPEMLIDRLISRPHPQKHPLHSKECLEDRSA